MKSKKLIVLLLFFAVVFLTAFAHSESKHIYDDASRFTREQVEHLEEKARSILKNANIDVIIVTTNHSLGKTSLLYAADYYEQVRGSSIHPNTVSFAFCFDIGPRGAYGEATTGKARNLLTKQGEDALQDLLSPYFKVKDYYGAMVRYLEHIEYMSSSKYVFDFTVRAGKYVVIGALIIAYLIVSSMKSSLKISAFKRNASAYIVKGSMDITNSQDIFLYSTTSKTKVVSSSNSNSNSNRSGGSFTSSSGRSYGGRSGSL